MKKNLIVSAAAAVLLAGCPIAALAAPSHAMAQTRATEVTGCLQQGPEAKEYLVHSSDGSTWAINDHDRDLMLNNYVGQTVTIAGDLQQASAQLKSEDASHILRARDVVVESQSCQK